MISYMKDICNWTAGPMQYIYNSKQKTLKPVSSGSPPLSLFFLLLPEETYLHTFRNITSKKKKIDKTQVIVLVTRFISRVSVQNAQALPADLAGPT